MKRIVGVLTLVFVVAPGVFVVDQAVRTLRVLGDVERERDTWQRPEDVLRALNPRPGQTIVDLGAGAGYFALKIAPRVTPGGRVLAVDLRRQSLAFLWIRAMRAGFGNLKVIVGQADDPNLPPTPIDAALIANTYHELTAPERIMRTLFRSMRPGARLVVVDRGPRTGDETRIEAAEHHEMTAALAEREITGYGFETVTRDERFIDRPQDVDVWWLLVFRRP